MPAALVERPAHERIEQPHDAADRIVGKMRIGDVPLLAVHDEMPGQRPAPADLDHVAERVRVGRLAEDAMVEALAALIGPLQELDRAVHGRSLLVAGDEETDRAGEVRRRLEKGERRRHHAGDAALHVDGAAPEQFAVLDDGGERIVPPAARIAGRHHVGVAGEEKVRTADAEAGVEIVDVRRAGLGEDGPMHLEAGIAQHLPDEGERAAFRRRDGGAADQRLGEGEGGMRRAAHRISSFRHRPAPSI